MGLSFKGVNMEKCGFYREASKFIPSTEKNEHMQVTGIREHRKWCIHPKHSPVTEQTARTSFGGGNLLQCGGDFARCQIPSDRFDDVV
jgi:hypothetical protein